MTPLTWRTLALSCAACLALGGGIGWRMHVPPPAPAVHASEDSREVERVDQHHEEGPSCTTITEYVPGPPMLVPGPAGPEHLVLVPGHGEILRVTVTERGPSVTDTRAREAIDHHEEVTVTPPPPAPIAGWAVGVGLQLLPDQRLELGLERRLFGPLWIRASLLQPATFNLPAVIVGLRMEF